MRDVKKSCLELRGLFDHIIVMQLIVIDVDPKCNDVIAPTEQRVIKIQIPLHSEMTFFKAIELTHHPHLTRHIG
jgi:hypothetical protein